MNQFLRESKEVRNRESFNDFWIKYKESLGYQLMSISVGCALSIHFLVTNKIPVNKKALVVPMALF